MPRDHGFRSHLMHGCHRLFGVCVALYRQQPYVGLITSQRTPNIYTIHHFRINSELDQATKPNLTW
jgi:hypothetical protein